MGEERGEESKFKKLKYWTFFEYAYYFEFLNLKNESNNNKKNTYYFTK